MAWAQPEERTAVIAVRIDAGSEPVLLHDDTMVSVYDGDGAVPIQSWGRRPDD